MLNFHRLVTNLPVLQKIKQLRFGPTMPKGILLPSKLTMLQLELWIIVTMESFCLRVQTTKL